MKKERNIGTLTVHGGNLCCNFINTVYAWRGNNLHEYLATYDDFIAWCIKLRVSDTIALSALQKKAKQQPEAANTALKRIKKIRLLLYSFISAIAAKNYKEIKLLLPEIDTIINKAITHMHFKLESNHFKFSPKNEPGDFLNPLWIVIQSLSELLLMEDIERIKECPRCGWVFLDHTKNNMRRWCHPEECGTADKMKRYYKRRRENNVNDAALN